MDGILAVAAANYSLPSMVVSFPCGDDANDLGAPANAKNPKIS